jgi:hypothetical protein
MPRAVLCIDCGLPAERSPCPTCKAARPYQTPRWRQFAKAHKSRCCIRCGSTRRLSLHHRDGRHPDGITKGRFVTLCVDCHNGYEGDRRAGRDTELTRAVESL